MCEHVDPPAWRLGVGLITPPVFQTARYKMYTGPRTWQAVVKTVMKLRFP
jgi:hypothetical protein